MADEIWGHCQHCKHFGSPARTPLVNEEAPCGQPMHSAHKLVVFGASGCTLFELRTGLRERIEEPAYAR